MKYSPAIYAKAFQEVVDGAPKARQEEVIKNFCKVIVKNGDAPQIDKICIAIEEQHARTKGGKVVQVEFAREMNEAAIKKITKQFKEHDLVSVKIAPSLIAGVRITVDGEKELDASLSNKLQKLWHTKS